MLAAMAPSAFARANLLAAGESVDAASHTRAEVIACASMVSGSSHARRLGHPAIMALPRTPETLASAADAAATAIPAMTHHSRSAAALALAGAVSLGDVIGDCPFVGCLMGRRGGTCGGASERGRGTWGTACCPVRSGLRTGTAGRTGWTEDEASRTPLSQIANLVVSWSGRLMCPRTRRADAPATLCGAS